MEACGEIEGANYGEATVQKHNSGSLCPHVSVCQKFEFLVIRPEALVPTTQLRTCTGQYTSFMDKTQAFATEDKLLMTEDIEGNVQLSFFVL